MEALLFFGVMFITAIYLLLTNAISWKKKYRKKILEIKEHDLYFIEESFLDFASALFMKYNTLDDKKDFKNLYPFISTDLIEEAEKKYKHVDSLIVKKRKIIELYCGINDRIVVLFHIKEYSGKKKYRYKEECTFERKKNIQSIFNEKGREMICPNCEDSEVFNNYVCINCNTKILPGERQWYLEECKFI